jgi:alpha-1,3-glucan synthase
MIFVFTVVCSPFYLFPTSGRGRTPTQLPPSLLAAANVTPTDNQYFLRAAPLNALDSFAFHYSVYRSISRFLGMDGNLQVAYDVSLNYMFGTSNFDVFRWPSLENGTQRSVLATFITTLVMPGIPLVRYIYIYQSRYLDTIFGASCIMAKNKTFISMILALQIIFMGQCFQDIIMVLGTE